MDAFSRAPAPPPLRIGPVRADTSPGPGTPKSADSMASSPTLSGEYFASPTTSASSSAAPLLWEGTGPSGSASTPSSPGNNSLDMRAVSSRKVNANSYCGRHSDEFLFGGKGLGHLWKAVTTKK